MRITPVLFSLGCFRGGGCNGTAKANQLIISRRVLGEFKRFFQKGKVRKERVMH